LCNLNNGKLFPARAHHQATKKKRKLKPQNQPITTHNDGIAMAMIEQIRNEMKARKHSLFKNDSRNHPMNLYARQAVRNNKSTQTES
jgi:hypothetical protein